MSEQSGSAASNQINQNTQGDRNQTIGQVHGGIVVYVSGGQAVINPAEVSATAPTKRPSELGLNPYKGLLAFNENDGDRYFGREDEIQTLWEKFWELHIAEGKTRLLPIYGPSGSGKSSLARAGLLPELGRRPLPGRERARVAVLVPGNDPLYSLAVVLAKIAKEDPNPVEKADEFKRVLKKNDDSGEFNGLNRIAFGLPEIATSPLIILVDQFEEIYAYEPKGDGSENQQKREKFIAERDIFIKNLLHAASDSSRYVSVIITCRSDFLGATQQYPELNKLFSTQGFLVPIMQPEDLAAAIAEPAKQAGYEFDPATVQLLVEQARGHQGALPLLQFALQRIWEGLEKGYEPLDTLQKIGGVGGALAEEAQKLYDSLSEDEQKIAPRIFVALVQVDETNEVSRRRARTAELITSENDVTQVETIIKRFAAPGVRFVVTSFTEEDGEIIEVAHEALIQNWQQLQKWIDECREALRKKRKIEQAAQEWKKQAHNSGYLLQGRPLSDACNFRKIQKQNLDMSLSSLADDFILKSLRKRRRAWLKYVSLFSIFPLLGTFAAIHFYLIGRASTVLWSEGCNKNPDSAFLVRYLIFFGHKKNLEQINLCNEELGTVDFSEAELWDANFHGASLRIGSKFQKAQLSEADFSKSILWGVDFSDADVFGAVFDDSFIYQSNLKNAKGLTKEQIQAASLCEVILPENFNLDPKRDCAEAGF